MKILFSPCHYVYDEVYGGSEPSWAFNIADRIASKNPESLVITGFKKIKNEKNYRIIELQKGENKLDISLGNALKFNWQYFLATKKYLKQENFDILHHVLPFGINNTYNLSVLLRKNKKVPFIIGPIQSPLSFRDEDLNLSNIRSYSPIRKNKVGIDLAKFFLKRIKFLPKLLSKATLDLADKIIVINQHTKDILSSSKIDSSKIEIIHPGIDIQKFKYVSHNQKDQNQMEILTVGYLIKRKGIELIIQALFEVIKTYPKTRLRIIGDGPQKENLKILVDNLSLKKNVLFEGFIPHDKIQECYRNSHIFVSMSRSESWGQMYLEAMACGLPVITTKNVGSNEIIDNGVTGYLIEQEDTRVLAEKILFLINNPRLMKKMGNNARKKIEKKYDWDKTIIPMYLDLYYSLGVKGDNRER